MAWIFNKWEITPEVTFMDGTSEYSRAAKFRMPSANVIARAAFEPNQFVDPRDGKVYGAKPMPDGKIWMTENLDYNLSGSVNYNNAASPPFAKAGRLYTWDQAMAVAPSGWHLPTDEEWINLVKAVDPIGDPTGMGTTGNAGTALKATSGWLDYNGATGNGTDDFGFAALPGGYGHPVGSFDDVGVNGRWWTATESVASEAWRRNMGRSYSYVRRYSNSLAYRFSVRCVQD